MNATEERSLRRLWSLHRSVAVEADADGAVLLAPWGETDLGERGLRVEDQLRRLTLGPVDIRNMASGQRLTDLDALLADISGAVVHTLELVGRRRSGLSAVPVVVEAPFHPVESDPHSMVRLSREAVIRPDGGALVVAVPGARHEVVCEGPELGGLLAQLTTSRRVSELSGRDPAAGERDHAVTLGATVADVEDIIAWLLEAGVAVERRPDGGPVEGAPERDRAAGHGAGEAADGGRRDPAAADAAPGRILLPPRRDTATWRRARSGPSAGSLPATPTLQELGELLGGAADLSPATRDPGGGPGDPDRLGLHLAVRIPELPPGVYRYLPAHHGLELVDRTEGRVVDDLLAACASAPGPGTVPSAALVVTSRRALTGSPPAGAMVPDAGASWAVLSQSLLRLVGRMSGIEVNLVDLPAEERARFAREVWPSELLVAVLRLTT